MDKDTLKRLVNILIEAKILISWFDIIQFAKDVFKITPTEYQEEFMRDFTKMNEDKQFYYKKHLVSGGRGAGKSLIASIVALWSVTILPFILGKEYRVILMGGSERQARKVYSYIVRAINGNPILESLVVEGPYREKTKFVRGELLVLPASEKAARHEHIDMLFIDEAAMVPEPVMKAALPIIGESTHPKLVLTSTPGPNPTLTFNDMLMNPESWGIEKVYYFDVERAPWKDKEELEVFKKKYHEDEYQREFKGQLVVRTKNAFDYSKWAKYGMEDISYSSLLPTYAGIDWGFSQESPTALTIAQVKNDTFYIITAHYIPGTDENYILNRIMATLNRYNVKEIYADASHPAQNNRLLQEGYKVIPIQAKNKKASMIYRLKNYLEGGKIRFPINLKNMLYEFSTYHWEITKDGRLIPRSKKDHIIDSIAILLEGYANRETNRRIAIFLTY